MHASGLNIDPMLLFLENLLQNPSHRAVEGLYRFLERCELPITDDGHFIAYKLVRENFTDMRTGQFNNSVGSVVEMPRSQVDDDPDNTCSVGLHFCSIEYLKSFHGQRLVAVKINPKDVVAIPRDYNDSKGRCSRYEVIQELPMSLVASEEDAWDTPVFCY
jgi:hypothetical protein